MELSSEDTPALAGGAMGHAIDNYIVDFCAPHRRLIIELDGSQHIEQQTYDEERTKSLEARGYQVLRFWNNDVMDNIDSVLKVIWNVLNEEEG
jgi:very-short-patch-repair endonuclease